MAHLSTCMLPLCSSFFLPCRLPPAQVAALLCSLVLTPDANGLDGSTLRISYQLKDSAGRTQVDSGSLIVRPELSYAADAVPPVGTQAAANALPDCDLSALSSNSGVGDCSVAVDSKFFPAAGTLSAKITLRVLVG